MTAGGAIPTDVGSLYAEHAKRVYRWILRFYPATDAEEVVHEVFIKVLERIEGFRHEASPVTWLYRMTINHCLNRRRNEGRRDELWREHGAPWAVPVEPADQDTVTFLRQFWHQLDDELVAIGFLHFVHGMTHGEIGRIHGCSPRTVGNRIERLRALALTAAGRDDRPNEGVDAP